MRRIVTLFVVVAAILVAAPAAMSCTILKASAGPVDVGAAGTVALHTDPIATNIDLNGLVGTLVCTVLTGGVGAPAVP
jgi:hypothetical protein